MDINKFEDYLDKKIQEQMKLSEREKLYIIGSFIVIFCLCSVFHSGFNFTKIKVNTCIGV